MQNEPVDLLDPWCALAGHRDADSAPVPEALGARTDQRHNAHTLAIGDISRREDIRALPARRQNDERVTLSAEGVYLSCKHVLHAIVIGYRRKHGCVRSQAYRRQRLPFASEPADELSGEMLRVRGAPAVAAHQNTTSLAEALGKNLKSSIQPVWQTIAAVSEKPAEVVDNPQESLAHRRALATYAALA